MLGFKLEIPKREDSVDGRTRPIYLDMQASLWLFCSNEAILMEY